MVFLTWAWVAWAVYMLEYKSLFLMREHEKATPQSSYPLWASGGTPSLEWMFIVFGVL